MGIWEMPEQQKSTDWAPPVVGLPQSGPEGLILIHNHQPHTVDQPIDADGSLTGFTAWYDLIPEPSNA
jgi:hypothetical protein